MVFSSRLGCVGWTFAWTLVFCILQQKFQSSMSVLHAQGLSAIVLMFLIIGCWISCIMIEVFDDCRWSPLWTWLLIVCGGPLGMPICLLLEVAMPIIDWARGKT